jgi:hypothetical protein
MKDVNGFVWIVALFSLLSIQVKGAQPAIVPPTTNLEIRKISLKENMCVRRAMKRMGVDVASETLRTPGEWLVGGVVFDCMPTHDIKAIPGYKKHEKH